MKKTIFTVGHSTHTIEYFLELLKAHTINCIVDVRSVAASKYNPQFNQEPLSNYLKKHGVNYLHFDKEFGARYTDKRLLDDNDTVDFEKVRATDSFKTGVERLDKGHIRAQFRHGQYHYDLPITDVNFIEKFTLVMSK